MTRIVEQVRYKENHHTLKIHSSYFFEFHDQEFVEEVYLKLLLREPDPVGLQKYLSIIRKGGSRYQVLRDIARSTESRQTGVMLEGMNAYNISRILKNIPVFGTIIEIFSFCCRIKSFRQDMRALENHIYRISQGSQRK
ncbi:hypothetical protein Sj15T_22820 [Sphingobium sp. TA15]|uniref:DUF4214 domain-containing protein n=1 Tax=Sphingobium TaxID=165695 RepID=UPI0009D668FE|nr:MULTISPECIES: DUF4214 domain-containing protein [Sphingobium]WDA38702.1 DUF4214 domain-containing protein [Sphingobium sp. YC-XJ3]BDD67261.1 hypothetical protein Sj15T_22820 [Sphingobium sp. TA15]